MIETARRLAELLQRRFYATPLGQFVQKYVADHADDLAVIIAWTALFSLFPLILGLLAILGFLIRDPTVMAMVQQVILQLFPSDAGTLLSFLMETRRFSGLLGLIGLVSLLWAGSALFGAMAMAFNRFYRVPSRDFLRQRLMGFTMIFVFFGLILVSVAASTFATAALSLSETLVQQYVPWAAPVLRIATAVVGWLISFGSAFLLFLAIYRVVPNVPLTVRDVWPGALLSAVLFVLLVQVWPLYVTYLASGLSTYAALGAFLLLVTWLWMLARIVVLGAVLNAFLHNPALRKPPTREELAELPANPWDECRAAVGRSAPSATNAKVRSP